MSADNSVLNYCYRADGGKFSALDADKTGLIYIGSLVYKQTAGSKIEFESAAFSDGRFRKSIHSWVPDYAPEYYLKDHLGSPRAFVDWSGELIALRDYYAFGKSWLKPNSPATSDLSRFNGKEEQTVGGAGLLDYGARFYHPDLGRWLTQDPMAEKFNSVSPYNFCLNNPLVFIDPDGQQPSYLEVLWMTKCFNKKAEKYLQKLQEQGWVISNFGADLKPKDTAKGYASMMFERELEDGSMEYALVIDGTAIFSIVDWINNITQIWGKSKQYSFSIEFAENLVGALNNGAELTFVGHSLGGGLATASEFAAKNVDSDANTSAIALNPANVSMKTITPNPNARIDTYITTNDILHRLQFSPVGAKLGIAITWGHIHYVQPRFISRALGGVAGHLVSAFPSK
ncbi:RHS repeat-associated core domain-containing protein [Alistipes putredinis]|uniref:RHS repeat-associated core domain-containing protein n=1 Tax=Alistipes putredinis TaxID=28117 RepID=UPI0024B2818E|nr:RHS repeat-associated core domain-containing protein [Alistipes putredinis]